MSRRVNTGMSSSIMTRGFADQAPHRPNISDADGSDSFSLKKLGATRAVRMFVYGALGVAAIAETTFWCSWLWSKAFKRAADEEAEQ
jgi:hypothetical protein